MSSDTDKAFPASNAYPEMEEKARDIFGDSLDFIDSLPDGPGKKLIIPFPYGNSEPKPYGWGLYPELQKPPSRQR